MNDACSKSTEFESRIAWCGILIFVFVSGCGVSRDANIVELTVLCPRSPLSSEALIVRGETGSELDDVLSRPMPNVTSTNHDKSLAAVIGDVSSRPVMWIPPYPNDAPWRPYGEIQKTWEGSVISVRDALESMINGSTEGGDPFARTLGARTMTELQERLAHVDLHDKASARLGDVVVITRDAIVILAVPVSVVDADTATPMETANPKK